MSYQIRVEGHLDLSWQEWFEGLELRHEDTRTTLLVGILPDQGALQGILLAIARQARELERQANKQVTVTRA